MERVGPAGARVLTIQWTELALKADPSARLTFQVLLFEGTHEVLFHSGPMRNGDGSEGAGPLARGRRSASSRPTASTACRWRSRRRGRSGRASASRSCRAGGPMPEGQRLGDLDGDGEVTILDQSRQVKLASPRYRPATALELVAADVAPLDSQGGLWGDGALRVSDPDLLSHVIVGRHTLPPYLSDLQPEAVAPLTTLTVTGSGFDPALAARNVVVLPRAGGGTLEVPAATVNATGSRLTLPQEARRGEAWERVGGRRTNARVLGVAGVPAILAIAPAPGCCPKRGRADLSVTIGRFVAELLSLTDGPYTGQGLRRVATCACPRPGGARGVKRRAIGQRPANGSMQVVGSGLLWARRNLAHSLRRPADWETCDVLGVPWSRQARHGG